MRLLVNSPVYAAAVRSLFFTAPKHDRSEEKIREGFRWLNTMVFVKYFVSNSEIRRKALCPRVQFLEQVLNQNRLSWLLNVLHITTERLASLYANIRVR